MTRDDYDDNPFDEHGLLRDGKRARVPLLMRDSMTPLQRSVAADAARRSGGVVFGDGSDNLACHKPGPRYRADAAADDVRWQAYLDGVKQEAEEWRKKPAADAGSGEFRDQQPSLLRCDQRGLGSPLISDHRLRCVPDRQDSVPRRMTADEAQRIRDEAYLESVRAEENEWRRPGR